MSTIDPQKLVKGLELFKRGQALHAAGALQQAAAAYGQATALIPNYPDLLIAYGRLAEAVQDWAAAERIYRRLLAVKPMENLDGKLGYVLHRQERYEEALPLLRAYAARHPGDMDVAFNISTGCFRTQRFDEGLPLARRAHEALQNAESMTLLLGYYLQLGEVEALNALVDDALRRYRNNPQVRGLVAEHLLKVGDVGRGGLLFRDQRDRPGGPHHYTEDIAVPLWDGKPFNGTLLVVGDQGIGDEIFASSMFRDLVASGQRAIIECDSRLLPVFRRSFPTLIFAQRGKRALREIIEQRPGEYKKILGVDMAGVLRDTPQRFDLHPRSWLAADLITTTSIRHAYEQMWLRKTLVGLSWKSQRAAECGVTKGVELKALAPLLLSTHSAFVNLQYGDITTDLASLGDAAIRLYVDPTVDTFNDIDRLFAQVAALDLVITTSNVTAHIAGASGKPCWLVLPEKRPVVWYWGYRGASTPWYPSIRIFRNKAGNDDWALLVDELACALHDFQPGEPWIQ